MTTKWVENFYNKIDIVFWEKISVQSLDAE